MFEFVVLISVRIFEVQPRCIHKINMQAYSCYSIRLRGNYVYIFGVYRWLA